jgi:hypothetical protein
MDTTLLKVALPSIQRAFHTSIAGSLWTIDAYTLVLACMLLAPDHSGSHRPWMHASDRTSHPYDGLRAL